MEKLTAEGFMEENINDYLELIALNETEREQIFKLAEAYASQVRSEEREKADKRVSILRAEHLKECIELTLKQKEVAVEFCADMVLPFTTDNKEILYKTYKWRFDQWLSEKEEQ